SCTRSTPTRSASSAGRSARTAASNRSASSRVCRRRWQGSPQAERVGVVIVSRGFSGKRREAPADRVPPGQYVTDDFPVLSAGGAGRLRGPQLCVWKSAKWARGLGRRAEDEPGFWESKRYQLRGDPWLGQRYWGG